MSEDLDMGPNMQRMDGATVYMPDHDLRSPEHRVKVAENQEIRDRCWNTGIEDESAKGIIDQTLAEMFEIEKAYPEVVDAAWEADHPPAGNPKDLMAQKERKVELGLLPPVAKEQIARVHMYGAYESPRTDGTNGYGPYNWRNYAIRLSVYLDAMERHIDAVRRGEWLDPASGLPHIAHVGAGVNIVLDAEHAETLKTDLLSSDVEEWVLA